MSSNFLPHTKCAIQDLGDVCILGKGVTGNAMHDYLSCRTDRFSSLDFLDGDEISGEKHYDLTIISPGISQFSDTYKIACETSDEVISEIEFAYRESEIESKWIAITGTNGKTTTTALTTHILNSCGLMAVAVGNIGDASITKVDGKSKIYVLECSSYQLASIDKFAPNACTILNITPDHLTWHNGFENYAKAKMKVLKNFTEDDYAIFPSDTFKQFVDLLGPSPCAANSVDLKKGQTYLSNLGSSPCAISAILGSSPCVVEHPSYVEIGNLKAFANEELDFCECITEIADEMQIKGEHNIENAFVALAIAVHMGTLPTEALKAIKTFYPLEHRIEPCGVVNGIKFYNDSKATNVDSTIKALSAFPASTNNVHLLLGGKDKLSDLSPLISAIDESCVREVVLYGASKARFLKSFTEAKNAGKLRDCVIHESDGMRDATLLAYVNSISGDVVLLSPACASFDEFNSFEHRGEIFKSLVGNLG